MSSQRANGHSILVLCEHMFVPAARPPEQFTAVKDLLRNGLSDYEVSRRTGIPRSTVLNWRKRSSPPTHRRFPPLSIPLDRWRPPHPPSYCYLLGLYLGDGCISWSPGRSPRLLLTLDARYPMIIEEAIHAIRATAPGISICRNARPGCVAILASHPTWTPAFPQHGPGRKHLRRIELAHWQRRLAAVNPQYLLRGLLHSDGSRCANSCSVPLPSGRIGHYSYTRYFFTNYSADIRRIFCDHCDLLGIRWTQSSFKNISIAHRESVAILDSFVGPKR
jgi:hypothetical protein